MFKKSKKSQSGLSLIEILIAVAIIGIFAAIVFPSINLGKSRGQALYADVSNLGKDAIRFNLDTSCYPLSVQVLFNKNTASSTSSNTCGQDISSQWNGPYINASPVNTNGALLIPNIASTAYINFSGQAGGTQSVVASNVPSSIAKQALRACNGGNGAASAAGSTASSSCSMSSATGNLVTFTYNYAQ